jgi:hypothetical protein
MQIFIYGALPFCIAMMVLGIVLWRRQNGP